MQEPASTIFSILNGIAAVFMLIQFRKRVPPKAPMYEAWHGYFAVSICLFSFFFFTNIKKEYILTLYFRSDFPSPDDNETIVEDKES